EAGIRLALGVEEDHLAVDHAGGQPDRMHHLLGGRGAGDLALLRCLHERGAEGGTEHESDGESCGSQYAGRHSFVPFTVAETCPFWGRHCPNASSRKRSMRRTSLKARRKVGET